MFLKSKRFLSLFLCAVLTLAAFSPVFGEISSESTGTKFFSDIDTEKVIAYLIVDPTSGSAIGFAEVFTNPMILPYRLIASAQVAMSLEPSVNRAMKINSIKAQLQSSYHVPLMKVRR